MATNPDNVYSGGLYYTTPSMIGGVVQGGFAFDLPLATVAHFNSQGLDFLAANSKNARSFFSGIMTGANAGVNSAQSSVLGLARSGYGTLSYLGDSIIASQERMNQINQEQATQRVALTPKPSSGGLCFITTAICEMDGKPDDCPELQILRKFRDDVMMRDSGMCELVREYYRISPSIARKIRHLLNGDDILIEMKTRYLLPAIRHVLRGEFDDAIRVYAKMVEFATLKVGA